MYLFLYFSAINKGDTKDTEMEPIMDEIVESLFSVFVTLGRYFYPLIGVYNIILTNQTQQNQNIISRD